MHPPNGTDVLMKALRVLQTHEDHAQTAVNLTASENTLSPIARMPLLADFYGRYMFNDTGDPPWNFSGARSAAWLETGLAAPTLRRLCKADHVNLRPLSGLHAMTLVLAALGGEPGQPVACLHPDLGGHYATADLARRLGLRPVLLNGKELHADLDEIAATLAACRPSLVYLDQSHTLFPVDVAAITATVRRASPRSLVYVDASHLMGLVLGGALPNPLDCGADGFGGSTHKTFPGPQKAFTATRDPGIAARIRSMQPVLISSHHFGATASLGLAAAEFECCAGRPFAARVLDNAQALARRLTDGGLAPHAADSGYTQTHQLWVRTAPHDIDAFEAAERLHGCGINVNVLTDLPGITEPALRIGVNEITYRGLTATDMSQLAELITDAVFARRQPPRIRRDVADLRASRTSPYQWPLDDPPIRAAVAALMARLLRDYPPSSTPRL